MNVSSSWMNNNELAAAASQQSVGHTFHQKTFQLLWYGWR